MLRPYSIPNIIEAGCDEAGRGPLAGSVFAAAVVFPIGWNGTNELAQTLNDSKQLSEQQRYTLRPLIEKEALAWAVAEVSPQEIDKINILQASLLGMRRALDEVNDQLLQKHYCGLQHILVDGNKWKPYTIGCTREQLTMGAEVPAHTIVKGDATYMSIAAASILAKTYRDDYMLRLHEHYPQYHWNNNKGYPTIAHYQALAQYGPTPYHRMTFNLKK